MSFTSRTYLVFDDNTIKRVPKDLLNGLVHGNDALPEYAGTTQRGVCVILDNDDGKPIKIVQVQGSYWGFDATGRIKQHLREASGAAMSLTFISEYTDEKVVSLAPKIQRREFEQKYRWEVTQDVLDLIASDIWPKIGLRSKAIASVHGVAPKNPPMTNEGKFALNSLKSKLRDLAYELDDMSEPTLKGLAFLARENSECETEHPELWRGLAAECDRKLEIKKRYRTGKGTWYAIIELFANEQRNVLRLIYTNHEKCSSKSKAYSALKKLIIEAAPRIKDGISLESRVIIDLEWAPDEP